MIPYLIRYKIIHLNDFIGPLFNNLHVHQDIPIINLLIPQQTLHVLWVVAANPIEYHWNTPLQLIHYLCDVKLLCVEFILLRFNFI